MKQKFLMGKKGIEDWKGFKDRRLLGRRKPKTKQLFFNKKGTGIWHKNQRKLCSKKNKGVMLCEMYI